MDMNNRRMMKGKSKGIVAQYNNVVWAPVKERDKVSK
jgi:hypothetical protein